MRLIERPTDKRNGLGGQQQGTNKREARAYLGRAVPSIAAVDDGRGLKGVHSGGHLDSAPQHRVDVAHPGRQRRIPCRLQYKYNYEYKKQTKNKKRSVSAVCVPWLGGVRVEVGMGPGCCLR